MNNPPSTALAAPSSAVAAVLSQPTVTVDVTVDAAAVRTTIVECDREVVQTFANMQAAHRGRLVESAWSIGLRAAMTAHRLAGESRLEDVGQRLVEDFTEQLESHQEQQQAAFARALAEYFDPKDGRVPARIEEFVRDGGELARTMAKYLSPDGELAKVLARSFGEASPLMKRLSPTDNEGVIQVMEKNLRTALQNQQTAFAAALDPSTENGALARFFVKLKADLKAASDDRDRQLAVITKSLDTNDKTSAMSRFFAESRKTYADLLKSMNPEDPATPLGSIKSTLTKLLEKHAKEHSTALALIEERQRKDGQELREALARFEVRRRVEARSAAGGATFEDAVAATVSAILRGAPATVEATGSKVGLRTHCKKGDVVVRFSEDHRYAGTAIVIEAKHDASFTVPRALEELETARANRGASAGVFVMARSHAPAEFPRFMRRGVDVLVVWDDGDPDSDIVLEAGLQLAFYMAPLVRASNDERGEIQAIKNMEAFIQAELNRCDEYRKIGQSFLSGAEKILEQARKGEKNLKAMLKNARKTLQALDIPLLDGDGEPEMLCLPGLSHEDAAE